MRLVSPQSEPRPRGQPFPAATPEDAVHESPEAANQEASPARLNESEREALLLNIDVSLRVHTRPQLFSWVQGALQSLIPHEVLLCGLQESRQTPLRVDSFSTSPVDCARLNELYQQDVLVMSSSTDTFGDFRFDGLPPGSGDYEVRAVHGSARRSVPVLLEQESIVMGEILLPAARTKPASRPLAVSEA